MDGIGYLEVDTPVLHTLKLALRRVRLLPTTMHWTLTCTSALRPSCTLKRLIVGGFDRVYEVGRIFRNEGMDTSHNPEFTSVEMYQAYTDYFGMMDPH